MRTIAVTSGKGGVGKTNISANLGIALVQLGHRVLILDADIGLANLDLVLGIRSQFNLQNVLRGECTLAEAIVGAPSGVHVLTGGSGVESLVDLNDLSGMAFFEQLAAVESHYDYLIVDTGAGLSDNLLKFLGIADEVLMVVTPDPASMSDAYATLKAHLIHHPQIPMGLVVNMAEDSNHGRLVFERMNQVATQYLGRQLRELGTVRLDIQALKSIRQRQPFMVAEPKTDAAFDVEGVARVLCGAAVKAGATSLGREGNKSFAEKFFATFFRRSVA